MKIQLNIFVLVLLTTGLISCNNQTEIASIAAGDSSLAKNEDFKVFWNELRKSILSKNTEAFKISALDSIYKNDHKTLVDSFISNMYVSPFGLNTIAKIQSNKDVDIGGEYVGEEYFKPEIKKLIEKGKFTSYSVVIIAQNPNRPEYILTILFFVLTKNGFKFYSCTTHPMN